MAVRSVNLGPKSRLAEPTPAGPADEPVTPPLLGCGCGRVFLKRSAWEGEAKDGHEENGVLHRYSRECRAVAQPERAGREGDQPLPAPGAASVFAEIRRRLEQLFGEREATGVRRYGRSLETFNGRDAFLDLEQELLDGVAYATQARMEHQAVVAALITLAKALLEQGGPPRAATDAERAAMDLAARLEAGRV